MPVILLTSFCFNHFLVPNYLLRDLKWRFTLYLIYLIIISVYLELLVMIWAFVILADYQFQNLGKIAGDIYLMTIVLYLIVFVEGLTIAVQKIKEKDRRVNEVTEELKREREEEIELRVNREKVVLMLKDILFVESMGDYLKIHTSEKTLTTKEKISSLKNRLPNAFVRIHRSFIVNKSQIDSFNKEYVTLSNNKLPIGRKYKLEAESAFRNDVIA